jgi:transcriptional regulator with XRE-family HTH domain
MEKWIENVIVLLHRHKITQKEIAEKYGCKREYINRILNGKETPPKGAEQRIMSAINEIIQERG